MKVVAFFSIKDVPIFEIHDTRGFSCDQNWMNEAISNHDAKKADGFRPMVIVGHNRKGAPDEKTAVGFIDNLQIKGKRLFADLVRMPATVIEKIRTNQYPNRSVEILPNAKRILALALLGGTTPHFALPQMVYENEEEAHWYRSPTMSNFSEEQKEELGEIFGEVIQSYSAGTEIEEPQIFELEHGQVIDLYNEDQMPEMYQDDQGDVFCYDDDGDMWYLPESAAQVLGYKYGSETAKKVGGAIATGARRTKEFVTSPARMKLAARSVPGVHRTEVAAGKAAAATAAGARSVKQAAGEFVQGARTGTLGGGPPLGRKARRAGAALHAAPGQIGGQIKKHPYIAGGAGLAAAGGAGYVAANRNREYAFDDAGVVYDVDGDAVGELVTYEEMAEMGAMNPNVVKKPHALPGVSPTTVSPMISEGAVGEHSGDDDTLTTAIGEPGSSIGPIDPEGVNRAESQQFEEDVDAEFYNLQHRVHQLETANSLLTAGRKAEKYRAVLEHRKAAGAPVGDVDQQIDYLMSLSDDQAQKHFALLDSQPKVQLGHSARTDELSMNFDLSESEVRHDYESHKDTYSALGVNDEDLKWAQYVRTNN